MNDSGESFVLILRPLPGVDGIRALRFGLKALKRHGLRAVKIEHGPETSAGPRLILAPMDSEREPPLAR
jgi:hypothetical protein